MTKREDLLSEMEFALRQASEANARLGAVSRRMYNYLLRVAPDSVEGEGKS